VDVLERRLVDSPAFRLEVERLAADHPGRTDRPCEPAHNLRLGAGPLAERRVGAENLECERLERVAGEDRRSFVEPPVGRGAAAAQVVVVHRGQIVVYQRIRMDEFDGGGDTVEPSGLDAEHGAGCVNENRAQSLAGAKDAIAQRLMQAFGLDMGGGQPAIERALDARLPSSHARFEFGIIVRAQEAGSSSDSPGGASNSATWLAPDFLRRISTFCSALFNAA